jgi:hypothetical protein
VKKLIIRISVALLLLIALALLAISLFLDNAVKRAVESFGPKYTKVDVKLKSVRLRLLSGSGKLTGLFVGNPQGFQTGSAITMSNATLSINSGSVFSDKVIVNFVTVNAIEVTYEANLAGGMSSNLKQIQSNLAETTGGSSAASTQSNGKPPKKLQVDDFLIRGGRIHVGLTTPVGAQTATLPLPTIHLTDLGAGPDGISPTELANKILDAIEKETAKTVTSKLGNVKESAASITKGVGKGGTNVFNKITKGIGDIFHKKKAATNE